MLILIFWKPLGPRPMKNPGYGHGHQHRIDHFVHYIRAGKDGRP